MNNRNFSVVLMIGWIGLSGPVVAQRVEELPWLYKGKGLEHWLQEINSNEVARRVEAIRAVASFQEDQPDRIRDLLIAKLRDESSLVRREASTVLRPIRPQLDGHAALVAALQERLVNAEEDQQVRESAARALGNLGLSGATALAEAIDGIEDDRIRVQAIEQLSRMPRDIEQLVEDLPGLREKLTTARVQERPRMDSAASLAWLRTLAGQLEDQSARRYALVHLETAGRIAAVVVPRLVQQVQNATGNPRLIAMASLRQWSGHEAAESAIPALSAALGSRAESVRFRAAITLAAITPNTATGDRAVGVLVEYLVQRSRSGRDQELLSYEFLFATAGFSRSDEIFRRVVAQLDGEPASRVRTIQVHLLDDVTNPSPDLPISLLKHQDANMRRLAIGSLRKLGSPFAKQTAPALTAAVQNPNEDQQLIEMALRALGEIDPQGEHSPPLDPQTLVRVIRNIQFYHGFGWLIPQLRRGGEPVIEELVRAIEGLPAYPGLIQPGSVLVNGDTPSDRFANALADIGKPAVPALRRLLIENAGDLRGRNAASALALIEPEGIQVLIELAGHHSQAVRRQVLVSIPRTQLFHEQILDMLVAAAKDEDPLIRQEAISAISRLDATDPRAVAVVIDNLEHEQLEVAKRAAEVLRRIGRSQPDIAVAALGNALRRNAPDFQQVVLASLQAYGETAAAALPDLRPLMKNSQTLKTIAAMGAQAKQAEASLRQQLDAEHPEQRLWAAVALSRFDAGVDAALPALIEFLHPADRRVHFQSPVVAAEALGEIGPAAEPAIEALLRLLRPPQEQSRFERNSVPPRMQSAGPRPQAGNDDQRHNPEATEAAIVALGQIGRNPETVVPALIQILERHATNPRAEVATKVATALGDFGAEAHSAADELVPFLPKSGEVYKEALLKIGSSAIPALVEALHDDDLQAKAAADLLGQMGPSAAPAVPELLNVVRDRGAPWHVREAAILALGRVGPAARPAIPYLEAMITAEINPFWEDASRSKAARTALEQIRT